MEVKPPRKVLISQIPLPAASLEKHIDKTKQVESKKVGCEESKGKREREREREMEKKRGITRIRVNGPWDIWLEAWESVRHIFLFGIAQFIRDLRRKSNHKPS
jgi:hypothetical protein